jgi:hypothetical protein
MEIAMDPFILFRKDHQKIRELLDRMAAIPQADRRAKLLSELQQNLYFHLDCEERFLFSRLLRLGETRPLAEAAVREHQRLKEDFARLLDSFQHREWEANLMDLRTTLSEHFEEEEDGLYEEAMEVFDEALLRAIAGQVREVKRERLAAG